MASDDRAIRLSAELLHGCLRECGIKRAVPVEELDEFGFGPSLNCLPQTSVAPPGSGKGPTGIKLNHRNAASPGNGKAVVRRS